MSIKDTALWGCGKIGRATAQLLKENNCNLSWIYDQQTEKAAYLSRNCDMGKILFHPPQYHPEVDIVIDATGDASLMDYWQRELKSGRVKNVIFTRREPEADFNMVIGVDSGVVPPSGTSIGSGSCTGNAMLSFLYPLYRNFSLESAACTVLHPLKQNEDLTIHKIPTALEKSVNDVIPEFSDRFDAISMEIPVLRGMVLDVCVDFKENISRGVLEEFFTRQYNGSKIFRISDEKLTNDKIVGSPFSGVLESDWKFSRNRFRGLIWQDNEYGFSSRIIDIMKILRQS
ncbi:MAG: hypothetical protein JXR95_07135 [Deltaproteobacteria bacterium]|nr:hypothetical protein [Deltaproteobacteria bacterium]